MTRYEELRVQYPRFYFRDYQVEETETELAVTYRFEIPGLSVFEPAWKLPKKLPAKAAGAAGTEVPAGIEVPAGTEAVETGAAAGTEGTEEAGSAAEIKGAAETGGIPLPGEGSGRKWSQDPTVREMIFSLGMVELVSYWKLCCPPEVVVEAGALSGRQRDWWKEQYFYGLGEFFYTNGIALDPERFLTIRAEERELSAFREAWAALPADETEEFGGFLIPIGGGKDSAVTLELLSEWKEKSYCYMINGRGATMATAKAGGYGSDRIVLAKRTLDPRMLELNRKGFLNGHTPFSAIVAFSSVLAAKLYGLRYVALSNESSANESTVAGSTVNHQYSKSFKFEQDFRSYEAAAIGSGISYFSLLRPWSEYQIAGYFAGLPQYHAVFRSCNVGSKQDVWCGHCPKCLFVYLILSPFLPQGELCKIFGKDLLSDETLIPEFDKLIGVTEEKPFECVGSRAEINTAVCEAIRNMEAEGVKLPALFEHYGQTEPCRKYREAGNPYPDFYEEENAVPERLKPLLRKWRRK